MNLKKTKDNEELGRMKEVVSSMENNALQSNQQLQKVLEDTLADLSAAQHKLKKTDQQLLEKVYFRLFSFSNFKNVSKISPKVS